MVRVRSLSTAIENKRRRSAITQLIKSCGNKKDTLTIRKLQGENPWITDDISIANTLIRSYAKCGALKEAQEVFDQLPERTVVSWNALIAGYAERGFGQEALACLSEMQNYRVPPDSVTYSCSLKACAYVGSLETVKKIHSQVREKQMLKRDIILGTALVNAYAKCGALNEAQEVFDQLAERDVVLWNALIGGYAEEGLVQEAIVCFRMMESNSETPDYLTYSCSLKACSTLRSLRMIKEIHCKVREQGLLNKQAVLRNALVNAYAKCGAMNEARELFDQLTEQDVVSWNALIDGYAEYGFGEDALMCLSQMESDGVKPDSVTYNSCLKACANLGAVEIVEEIHSHVKEQGLLNKHNILGNTLVNTYAKCGAFKEARELFDQLMEKDVVVWNALISGYAEHGLGEEALTCFSEMESNGVAPDSVTYACSLKACAIVGALEIVKQIHTHVNNQGLLKNDITLGTALVNAYVKCGIMKEAQDLFDQLTHRNVISWNALIGGYVDHGFSEEALMWLKEMESDGVRPDSVTYAGSLKACAALGAVGFVKQIHGEVKDQGLLNEHLALANTLINAYAKCGSVKEAWQIFQELEERNVESWNAVLVGFVQLGCVNEMPELLNRMMMETSFPDPITFLVLQNCFSHGGFLEEGERLFCMIKTFGLAPAQEHCTCMIDLFGRAGQCEKAKYFVVDHTPTLLAFLGACQKWVEVDLGRWAFEKLLQIDEKCASGYVCMANIYAASGLTKV